MEIREIRKLIDPKVYREIKSACGSSINLLLGVLNEINMINIMPTDTDGSDVYYIQNEETKKMASMDFKNVNRMTQGFCTR